MLWVSYELKVKIIGKGKARSEVVETLHTKTSSHPFFTFKKKKK